MFSVMFGRNEILSLLITKGADLTIKDNRGQTALDLALMQGNEEGANLLAKAAENAVF